jgi:hypothetical protein
MKGTDPVKSLFALAFLATIAPKSLAIEISTAAADSAQVYSQIQEL